MLTEGPIVADLNAQAGLEPDPQQELALDMIFGVGANGLPSSFAFCVICCRQNLKTALFKMCAVGWLFVTAEKTIVWSAHEMTTTRDAQSDLEQLLTEAPALAKRLPAQKNQGVYTDNNATRIELATGQEIKFKARTKSGGRGLTGDKVILDEAFALRPAHVGSLIPTMGARPAGQVLYGSSAGMADSDVLRDVRDRGRNGTSPRLSYLEWLAEREECEDFECAHPKDAMLRGIDCALDREHLLEAANPTLSTGRMTLQTLRDFRQELPPEEFARECLGWWDEPLSGAENTFGAGRWEACASDVQQPAQPAAIGIGVSVDRLWASIASSAYVTLTEDNGTSQQLPFVAGTDRREDTGWVVSEAKRIQDTHGCEVVVDEKGPAGDLVEPLEKAGVRVTKITLSQYVTACSEFFDRVRARELLHPSSSELDAAVAAATWRTVGERRAWARKNAALEISMLEAATCAVYGTTQAKTEAWGFFS